MTGIPRFLSIFESTPNYNLTHETTPVHSITATKRQRHVAVTRYWFQGHLLRDIYAYECKFLGCPQPCFGQGRRETAMMDHAASEWFACEVSLAWIISLNEEIDPHIPSRFNTLALLHIMGSDGWGGVTSISACNDNWADCDLGTQGRAWLHDRWQRGLAAHTPSLDQIVKLLLKRGQQR